MIFSILNPLDISYPRLKSSRHNCFVLFPWVKVGFKYLRKSLQRWTPREHPEHCGEISEITWSRCGSEGTSQWLVHITQKKIHSHLPPPSHHLHCLPGSLHPILCYYVFLQNVLPIQEWWLMSLIHYFEFDTYLGYIVSSQPSWGKKDSMK